ncbi:MFS transporter [Candidatus Saccharibacteria bacterium]|nr:MFS transporter [Candidatus Saccharibacteria bacterium]
MSYEKIKRLFYTFAFFDDFLLIYPLYAILFSEKGLNPAQISSLFIAWSVTGFLLEVPSGSAADKYPRRTVLLFAIAVRTLAFTAWLVEPTYSGFLTGFILWGISGAFVSGTEEALVYDELTRVKKTSQYSKVTGRMESLRIVAFILASFLASLLANRGYSIILILSSASVTLSAAPIYLLPKTKAVESTDETKYFTYVKTGIKLVLKNSRLLFIIGFASIIVGLGAADEYFNLLFDEKGFSNSRIAILVGVVSLFGALGTAFAHKLENKKVPVFGVLLVAASLLLTSTLVPAGLVPIILGLYLALTYIVGVLFNTYLQQEATDANRATMTSVQSLAIEFFVIITYCLFAIASQFESYNFSFQVLAIILFVIAIVYAIVSRVSKTWNNLRIT